MDDAGPPPRVLALGCGEPQGSAEILLGEAGRGASALGAHVDLVRLSELQLSSDPRADDDTDWFWDRLMECDALLVATPVISRTVPARLKLLADRVLGPWADAAMVEQLLPVQRAGGRTPPGFRVDERVLRPRVAGFLAVGGAHERRWTTLALPVLHTLTFPLQIAVVDQTVVHGAGTPQSVVLDERALERAELLGTRVAGQLGRAFDDVEYQGEPGVCPVCHLDVVELVGSTVVECATCGAQGEVEVLAGDVVLTFPERGREASALTMSEKRAHFRAMQETGRAQGARRAEIAERAGRLLEPDRSIRPDPPPRPSG